MKEEERNYDRNEKNINWEEVEYKVSIILRKFSNIDQRFKDDLAQELRIHAYYNSDDYYDLHRKAVDFWRTLTRRVYPEIPFIDLELTAGYDLSATSEDNVVYMDTLTMIKKELESTEYKTTSELRTDSIALEILDIIAEDIEGVKKLNLNLEDIPHMKYRNGKINMSYLDLRMGDIHYKSISKALNRLKDLIIGLQDMGKL